MQVIGRTFSVSTLIFTASNAHGAGFAAPNVLVHGFNSGGVKMARSLGNGVGPADIIPDYGMRRYRYYFLRHVPTQDDGDFARKSLKLRAAMIWDDLVQRVAKMVQSYIKRALLATLTIRALWDHTVKRWKVMFDGRNWMFVL